MASGRFSKQAAPYLAPNAINANNSTGDSVLGGTISAAPSGLNVSQFQQNLPGDRFIFSPADALAYQNNNTGNLFTGTYRYVLTAGNATANCTRGKAAFWDPTANGGFTGNNIGSASADKLYTVTPDGNGANYTNTLFAGAFINNMTKGNYWFIQESGKMSLKFRAAITGTPAIGAGVYLTNPAPANNNTDNGSFDQLSGGNIGSGPIAAANFYATLDGILNTRVGVAETLPSNNNVSVVDVPFGFGGSFRW